MTTRAHVVGPFFVPVRISVAVVPLADRLLADVRRSIVNAVCAFLDPHTGGGDGKGWPFGRNVFASEIFALLDRLSEVDFVTSVSLTATPQDRVLTLPNGQLIGVEVRPHELVRAEITAADVTVAAS